MSKTAKIIVGIIITIVVGAFIFILGIATCGLFSAIALPAYLETANKAHKNDEIKLQKYLETSMNLYELDEGKWPEKFSDFVVLSGKAEAPYTFSFSDLENKITEPASLEDLDSAKLKVRFAHGVVTDYVLNPPDIEMTRVCD